MAEKAQLEITIGADGRVHVETHGLKGQDCLTETKELEKALGRVRKREKTSEFYEVKARASSKLRNR